MTSRIILFFLLISLLSCENEKISIDEIEIITSQNLLLNDTFKLSLKKLPSNVDIEIHTRLKNEKLNKTFHAYGKYKSNENGEIDILTSPSKSGYYEGIDRLGLFWSMKPFDKNNFNYLPKQALQQDSLYIDIVYHNNTIASKKINWSFTSNHTIKQNIDTLGLKGSYFKGEKDKPLILILGGSEGGLKHPDFLAKLISSKGYSAISLAYFGEVGLPNTLENIPLEYFKTALEYIQKNYSKKIILMGYSRGGELSLLLGSKFPKKIKGIISYVPSYALWSGFDKYKKKQINPAWIENDTALHFMFVNSNIQSSVLSHYYENTIDYFENPKSIIKVEAIECPILLLSGTDDHIWPSTLMCEKIIDRLKQKNYQYAFEHVPYKNAGHQIIGTGYSYFEKNRLKTNGGTAKANAYAQISGWNKILEFLSKKY